MDTKKQWNPEDQNFLAVAKFDYIIPLPLKMLTKKKLLSLAHIQKTLTSYDVEANEGGFQVTGTFLTPSFYVKMKYIDNRHEEIKLLSQKEKVDLEKARLKALIMYQSKFGRVMFFRTAKMATALVKYKSLTKSETLVTQYILSNIINVPAKSMIKKGMLENIKNVVIGSRKAFNDTH